MSGHLSESRLRILLAEDVNMIRGALVALLELQPDLQVVVQLERGDGILQAALRHQPDVAVIDLDLPGFDGLKAATQLHEHLPDCRTLILSGIEKSGTLRRILCAGVSGLMLKSAPSASLAKAVRDVASGQKVVDPGVPFAMLDEPKKIPLTAREIETLELTAAGSSPREIAEQLFLATGTVRNYLTSITTKLNARTQVDAVRIAREAGWIH
jgi:two-component system response regulator DesR